MSGRLSSQHIWEQIRAGWLYHRGRRRRQTGIMQLHWKCQHMGLTQKPILRGSFSEILCDAARCIILPTWRIKHTVILSWKGWIWTTLYTVSYFLPSFSVQIGRWPPFGDTYLQNRQVWSFTYGVIHGDFLLLFPSENTVGPSEIRIGIVAFVHSFRIVRLFDLFELPWLFALFGSVLCAVKPHHLSHDHGIHSPLGIQASFSPRGSFCWKAGIQWRGRLLSSPVRLSDSFSPKHCIFPNSQPRGDF